jgi:hypothetical protein
VLAANIPPELFRFQKNGVNLPKMRVKGFLENPYYGKPYFRLPPMKPKRYSFVLILTETFGCFSALSTYGKLSWRVPNEPESLPLFVLCRSSADRCRNADPRKRATVNVRSGQ